MDRPAATVIFSNGDMKPGSKPVTAINKGRHFKFFICNGGEQYRLIILRKSSLSKILSTNLTDYSTQLTLCRSGV